MAKKVWVQGPIALDTVVYLSNFPIPGSFMNSVRTEERTGGTSANVALGLCTASVETGFVSYLGNDDVGKQLLNVLEQSQIKELVITYFEDKTNHALVLVDEKSERTIISMTTPHLRELRMDKVPFKAGDIVVFVLWREEFLTDLLRAQAALLPSQGGQTSRRRATRGQSAYRAGRARRRPRLLLGSGTPR